MPFDDAPSDERSNPPDAFGSLEGSNSREETAPADPDPLQVALVRGGSISFEQHGFRILSARRRRRPVLHSYASMTHVYVADRMLLIGLTSGLLTIRTRDFMDQDAGPTEARRLLLARLAARPDGQQRLEEMADLDRLGARKSMSAVTWATVALCIAGTWLQLIDPMVEQAGSFLPDLFARGEYWRGVTAHFLHGLSTAPAIVTFAFGNIAGLPIHLAVNVGGLLVLGHLVERPLGSWRTAIIVAVGGVGTMTGILYAEHFDVIGASGLVSAFAGAILAMELNYPGSLPSYWRLPRRLFIFAVILQFLVIDQLLARYVAGGAHLGGFLGGYVATWFLGRPSLANLAPTTRLRVTTYGAIGLLVAGILGALPLARHEPVALERHAVRLLSTRESVQLYQHENAAAWFLATEGGASPFGLELAVALADRAVASTGRMHPGVLDTLAEALFQSGDRLAALLAIDEAIRLMPNEAYFIEQRRRFTGERSAEDRPPPPGSQREGTAPFDEDFENIPIDKDAPFLTI